VRALCDVPDVAGDSRWTMQDFDDIVCDIALFVSIALAQVKLFTFVWPVGALGRASQTICNTFNNGWSRVASTDSSVLLFVKATFGRLVHLVLAPPRTETSAMDLAASSGHLRC
jgi:hypothetical protein